MTYPHVDTLLFFGSFDPVTIGHEAVIQAGIDLLSPAQVVLIPASEEGWGKRLSSFTDREAMIQLAITTHPEWKGVVSVSAVERDAHLSGITADTLHYLQAHGYGGKDMGFLMGADWILSFPTWEEWEWMLSVAPAFVVLRGEETLDSVLGKLPDEAKQKVGISIFLLPEEKTRDTRAVSSTIVRTHFRTHNHSDHVLPVVREYIQANSLYRDLQK